MYFFSKVSCPIKFCIQGGYVHGQKYVCLLAALKVIDYYLCAQFYSTREHMLRRQNRFGAAHCSINPYLISTLVIHPHF